MSVSGCVCCLSRKLWQSWCLVWNILCGFGQPAAAVATEDGEEDWDLHANPSVSSVRKSFQFFWSALIFFYNACFLFSLFPPLSLSLAILSAQETIKSALPTFFWGIKWENLSDYDTWYTGCQCYSRIMWTVHCAWFKIIHNASEYETDPIHITRIIHPKIKIMSAFNHPDVEHK